MPLLDITNPAVIIFLKKNYVKENRLRLNWILKNKESIEKAAKLTREPTNYYETDVIAHKMKEGMATITRDHVVAGYNRRKVPIRDGTYLLGVRNLRQGYSIVDIGLGEPKIDPRLNRPPTDLKADPIMRPVNPNVSEVLYRPKPKFGWLQYLLRRWKLLPEKMYYFTECSNWEYGWRMGDSVHRHKPMFGRCWHLTRTMRTRVGPQPDPPHYKPSAVPGPAKCIAI